MVWLVSCVFLFGSLCLCLWLMKLDVISPNGSTVLVVSFGHLWVQYVFGSPLAWVVFDMSISAAASKWPSQSIFHCHQPPIMVPGVFAASLCSLCPTLHCHWSLLGMGLCGSFLSPRLCLCIIETGVGFQTITLMSWSLCSLIWLTRPCPAYHAACGAWELVSQLPEPPLCCGASFHLSKLPRPPPSASWDLYCPCFISPACTLCCRACVIFLWLPRPNLFVPYEACVHCRGLRSSLSTQPAVCTISLVWTGRVCMPGYSGYLGPPSVPQGLCTGEVCMLHHRATWAHPSVPLGLRALERFVVASTRLPNPRLQKHSPWAY